MKNRILPAVLAITAFAFQATSYAQPVDSAGYFFQKGLAEKQNGRRMEALKNFERAQRYDSTNKEVLRELGASYLEVRKYFQAREAFQRLERAGDNSAANYKQLLTLSYNLKQPNDVVMYANQLKRVDPSEKVSYYIGKVHYDQENYGEAIKALNAAEKEEPTNAEVPYMIARSYADMLNYNQSIPYFQKAINLDTSKAYWVYEMALIYYAMNDTKNTLKYMLQAGDKGLPKSNDYMENLGIAYLDVGDLENGIRIMSEILKRKPSDINILNMVAEAYYYKGKFGEAMEYWDRILEYDKKNASALYMIGMCYQKKGEKQKGQLLCDKAIEMDPSLSSLKQAKQLPGM